MQTSFTVWQITMSLNFTQKVLHYHLMASVYLKLRFKLALVFQLADQIQR